MFCQDNKSICAFSLSFHSLSWIRSYNAQFLQFLNQSSGTLWLSSNWKVIFTTAALLCGMIFREELVKSIILPWTCKLSLHFMNSPVPIRWWYLVLIALMRWWYQSREGEKDEMSPPSHLHLSPFLHLYLSISIFLSLHFPSSIPIFPARRGRLTSFIQWRFLQDQVKATQLNAIDLLFGQRTSCQSGRLVARGRENDREGNMWTGKAMVLFIWVRTRHLNHSHDNYLTTFSPNIYLGSNTEQASWFQIQFQPRKGFRPCWTMPGSPGGPNSSAA